MPVETEKSLDEAVADAGGIVRIEGDILCHVEHQGAYTDVGVAEELHLIEELSRRPWREVVAERYAERLPWLYRIITDGSRSRMLAELDPPTGGRFLDVGSGWGQLTIPLARLGEAHALDLTPTRLRILREIARQEGVEPHLHCGNLLTYPFREGVFDVVILNGVLEYLGLGRKGSDYQSHLEALRRVSALLARDGRAYIGIENALGLKYVLGAPDDHTGRSRFTYLRNRPDGTDGRTWALDQYLELFHEAGLKPERTFACFPDYKLIQHMVDLRSVDQFLLELGLPAHEHSGVNGAPLGLDEELRSLYQSLARLGVARYFVPSFGFVLRRRPPSTVVHEGRSQSLEQGLEAVLEREGLVQPDAASDLRLVPAHSEVSSAEALQTWRYFVRDGDRPVASVKQVPRIAPFDPAAILAVYEEYQKARTFRPVRLLESWQDEHSLWLTEEYIPEAASLDDLLRDRRISADEAMDRIVSIVDDIWEMGTPADAGLLERELDACEGWFTALFEDGSAARSLYRPFHEMMWSRRAALRTVLTTRDYIGRNVLTSPVGNQRRKLDDREWMLVDYDLAARSTLFALGVARNCFQVPYCNDRLLRAKVFEGLDPLLVKVAAAAAECALQRQVSPPAQHEAIVTLYRSFLLRVLSPRQMEQIDGHQRAMETEIREAREYQATLEQEIRASREYQRRFEPEIDQARKYQANLEGQLADLRRPPVDVMVVNYNSGRWIDGFFDSLRGIAYPAERLRLVFVDNASSDGSFELAQQRVLDLPFPTEFVQTGRNAGFTGGYQTAFGRGDARYYFVINIDTRMAPDAISRLIGVLEADPRAGIAEARQAPLEHPKYYDPVTRETSWCSGACMMVRTKALHSLGSGFDETFFMYAEDVDLSWRMWLHGWKCLYVPEAVVEHFTEHLDPDRDHSVQHYFSMRNGAIMRIAYGTLGEVLLHYLAMLRVGTFSRNPRWHKRLTLKAIAASLRRLPSALRKRRRLPDGGRHPWIFFDGWLYGRHERDPAADPAVACRYVQDLVARATDSVKTLSHDLPIDQHIVSLPSVFVAGAKAPAILVYDSGALEYNLVVPADAVICGAVAAPEDCWKKTAAGRFTVQQDGRTVWQETLTLDNLTHRRWVSFEAPLQATVEGRPSQVTLRFDGVQDLAWGLWGGLKLAQVDRSFADHDPADELTGLVVSLIMPTHNRADGLERVIRRLMSQDVPRERFEVLLVDSNSQDHTPHVAAELARCFPNLKALRSDRPGAAAARNMGLEAARGELVVLLDDDILVGPDFLRRVLRSFRQHPSCVLLGRIVAPWDNCSDPFQRYLLQVQDVNIYDFPDPSNVPANYFYTACVAIPREVLRATRFDEGFHVYGVEDIEFGFRLLAGDVRMVYLPDLRVLHDYHPSYRPYRRKKHKAGYSLGYFLQQHPEHAHRFQFGQRFRKYYHLLRAMRTLGAPAADLLYLMERIAYRHGPVNRWLYRWLYVDLRIQLYSGLLRFRRGAPPPA